MSDFLPIEPDHNLGDAPRGSHWELRVTESGRTYPVAIPDVDSEPLSPGEIAYRLQRAHADIRAIGRA